MKKVLLSMCLALVALGASAQKGDKFVGANVSYNNEVSNVGIGVKGQYFFTDKLRGEASADYFLKKDGLSMWDINANVHYLFNVADKFKVYPLAGVGYTNWKVSFDDDEVLGEGGSSSTGKIAINLGGGAQYELSEKMVINAELKYQIIDNYNSLVFGVGVAFKI